MAFDAEALVSYITQDYCLLILDINLSAVSGANFLQAIQKVKKTPILALTDILDDNAKINLYQVGADACIEKSQSMAICAAQANDLIKQFSSQEINHKLSNIVTFGTELSINPSYREVIVDGTFLKLTRREFDIFHYLAVYPGKVFSRGQLYNYAWNNTFTLSVDEAVKAQIKGIRKKLALIGKYYIHTQWGVGYRFALTD